MREWFAKLILYSQTLTLAGEYAAFDELGGAVLRMVADTRRQGVNAENVLSLFIWQYNASVHLRG